MRRGDLVTVAMSGDFGKPRPALVIQSDLFPTTDVTVVFLTGTHADTPLLRVPIEPDETNGLRKPSQVMVDKIMTVKRAKVGKVFGRVDDDAMIAVSRSLAVFLGIV